MDDNRIHNMVMFRTDRVATEPDKMFLELGRNTGNMVFAHALQKNMHVTTMPVDRFLADEQLQSITDAVLCTDLIWITANSDFSYLEDQMNKIQKPYIAMSVGVQNGLNQINETLNPSVLRVLSMMQERAVLGVRGEITADILNKNGIKNIQIIGCPSLYYWNHPNFRIEKKDIVPQKVAYNFRTFYGKLSRDEAHFLSYCASKCYDFIEQTEYDATEAMCPSREYYEYVIPRLNEKKKLFFHIDEWIKQAGTYDFTIGGRFHGNVLSLWNGIPALFIMVDSRMKEMLDYFRLPRIEMAHFDETKPIGYYYDLADYTEFNSHYAAAYENYLSFMKKNNMIY